MIVVAPSTQCSGPLSLSKLKKTQDSDCFYAQLGFGLYVYCMGGWIGGSGVKGVCSESVQ